jgi:hypothetical protein
MITKKRLIELIQSHSEGSTDRVADGVLFDMLADAILLELQQNNAKPIVSGALPCEHHFVPFAAGVMICEKCDECIDKEGLWQ